jgi:hypothetical protein
MKLVLFLAICLLVGCAAESAPELALYELDSITWQPHGASYVFACKLGTEVSMSCVAKSLSEKNTIRAI